MMPAPITAMLLIWLSLIYPTHSMVVSSAGALNLNKKYTVFYKVVSDMEVGNNIVS
jgi:hypothetical protein